MVHLEGATNSSEAEQYLSRMSDLQRQCANGELTLEEYKSKIMEKVIMLDSRIHGTALYVRHAGFRYLVTARHVIIDTLGSERQRQRTLEFERKRLEQYLDPEELAERIAHTEATTADQPYPTIFRVPSWDEHTSPGANYFSDTQRRSLKGLHAGAAHTRSYFCSDTLDVAVIDLDLDSRSALFADELDSLGFVPIDSTEIKDSAGHEGQEVFTVGFPEALSPIETIRESAWLISARIVSVPVFSFGHVAMLRDGVPYFLADMTISPGNSGGPVVANGHMVGVIYGQPTIPLEGEKAPEGVTSRGPFAFVVSAAEIRRMLDGLAARHAARRKLFWRRPDLC